MGRDLERSLEIAGVRVVDAGQADIIVELSRQTESRRSVSVAGDARAAEYEMELRVIVAVADGDGNELVAQRTLTTERVFQLDRDNVVGSSDEQALLVREMRDDVVQRIMQTLGTLTSQRDENGEEQEVAAEV